MVLQEVMLSSEDQAPAVDGFVCFPVLRKNASRASGGTLVYVSASLSRAVSKVKVSGHPDVLWLRFDPRVLDLDQPLFMGFVYVPPWGTRYHDPLVWDELRSNAWHLSGKGYIVVTGDLNGHMPSDVDDGCDGELLQDLGLDPDFCVTPPPRLSSDERILNPQGRCLLDLCHSSPLVVLNGRLPGDIPAAQTHKSGGVLDYFLGDVRLWPYLEKLVVLDSLGVSDHSPVRLSLLHVVDVNQEEARRQEREPDSTSSLKWEGEKAGNFAKQFAQIWQEGSLQERLECVQASNVVEVVEHLHITMKQAAQQAGMRVVPRTRKTSGGRQPKVVQPWFNAQASRMRRELRKVQREKGTQHPQARAMQRTYSKYIRKQKRAYRTSFAKLMNELYSPSPGDFWKLFYSRPPQTPGSHSPEQWAAYFERLLNYAETDGPLPDGAGLRKYFFLTQGRWPPDAATTKVQAAFSLKEVYEALKTLKRGKSVGVDGIPVEVYKCLSDKLIPFFATVFNTLFELGFFPKEWAISIVSAIFKSGDPEDQANYRGVSVIVALSKWYARLMDLRLSDFAESCGLRARTQAGFRKGYCTFDQLLILQSVFNKYVHKKAGQCSRVYCCFIDFRKAYDMVIWDRLWVRLRGMGLPEKVITAIRAYYEGAQACVKTFEGLSSPFTLSRGVKQGCPLSCTLFGLFIDAIHEMLSHRLARGDLKGRIPDFGGIPIPDLLFADDTLLLSLDPEALQILLEEVAEFCKDWGMVINVDKTKVMVCRKEEDREVPPSFHLGSQEIEMVESYKYLGLHFHYSKGLGGSAEHRLAAAKKATFALQNKCIKTGIHNPLILCGLFRTIVMPVMFHGAQVAFPFWTKAQVDEADLLFKRYMKTALGVPANTPDYFVYGEISQFPISLYPIGWVIKYWNKIWSDSHQSHLTRSVVEEDWKKRFSSGLLSSWVSRTWGMFIQLKGSNRLELGDSNDRLIPREKEQIHNLRNEYQDAWEQQGEAESSYHQWYRQLRPDWRADKLVWVSDKSLRIILTRFRAGCFQLKAGPRHGHQNHGDVLTCPCCLDGHETLSHFFFECEAYAHLRNRWNIHCFSTLEELFSVKLSQLQRLARFIKLAWRLRSRCVSEVEPWRVWNTLNWSGPRHLQHEEECLP